MLAVSTGQIISDKWKYIEPLPWACGGLCLRLRTKDLVWCLGLGGSLASVSLHSALIKDQTHECGVLWMELWSPQKDLLKPWPLILQSVTLFGGRVLTEVIKVKARLLGWFLTLSELCPCKRNKDSFYKDSLCGGTEIAMHRRKVCSGVGGTQGQDGHLGAKEGGQEWSLSWQLQRQHGPANTLVLDVWTLQTVSNKCLLFKPPVRDTLLRAPGH